MLRNTFIHTEYERTLRVILSNAEILNVPTLLFLIADYVGNKRDHLPKLSEKQEINKEISIYDYCSLLIAPPGSGKTALLTSIQTFNHLTLKFDFEEIVADTLDGALNFFEMKLLKEADRHKISLDIKNELGQEYALSLAFNCLITKLHDRYNQCVIIKIDNYDTPLLASYYYHYYDPMKHWLYTTLSRKFNCRFILTALTFCTIFSKDSVVIKSYHFSNHPHPFFESKEPSSLGGTWIPELIKKNKTLLSELKKNSYQFVYTTRYSSPLDLNKITTDSNEFYKFLTYLGYFISAKQAGLKKYLYELTPNPRLLEILKEPSLEQKESISYSNHKTFFSKKPLSAPPKIPYSTNPLLHFNGPKQELKKTENIIFLDMEVINSDNKKFFHEEKTRISEIKSHPKISNEFFQQVNNKYFLWQILFRYNEEVSQYVIHLCLKHSAKIILYSFDHSNLKISLDEMKRILSLTPLAPYVIDRIITPKCYQDIQAWLIQANPHLRSFVFLSWDEEYFFEERNLYFYKARREKSLKKYFNKADDLLSKTLYFETSSLRSYWDTFSKGKISSAFFDLKKSDYLQVILELDKKELQNRIFKWLPLNNKLEHLTLNNFAHDDFKLNLIFSIKNMPFLKYLCISHNKLTRFNSILEFLDGKTHHIAEIDFSHNLISIDGQISLATWLEFYPRPIKFHFNTSYGELDACILKAIHRNPNIQFFSDTLFQPIRTPLKELDEITEQMRHQERFIYTNEKKDHNKRHCIIS
jgi:hypothetical protein